MNSIYNKVDNAKMIERINALNPENKAVWGINYLPSRISFISIPISSAILLLTKLGIAIP